MGVLEAIMQAAATVALVLAAAKAHGRQLRLEREQAGYPEADFRGPNPPWVEGLWRRDRIRFWGLFAVLACAALLAALVGRWPPGVPSLGRVALGLAWAFAACFCALGLASLWRLASRAPRNGWPRHARVGSLLWWALVALLLGVSLAASQY